MSFNHSPGGRLCLSLALSLSVSLSVSTTLYFLLLFFFFSLHSLSSLRRVRSLISRAIRYVYVLLNEGRVRSTTTSLPLPPHLPPTTTMSLNFYDSHDFLFFTLLDPLDSNTLLYSTSLFFFFLLFLLFRRVCKPSSPCSCFHATRGGVREGVEIS